MRNPFLCSLRFSLLVEEYLFYEIEAHIYLMHIQKNCPTFRNGRQIITEIIIIKIKTIKLYMYMRLTNYIFLFVGYSCATIVPFNCCANFDRLLILSVGCILLEDMYCSNPFISVSISISCVTVITFFFFE